jgi:LPPG:FO 2-phospho-L-lactate transferase
MITVIAGGTGSVKLVRGLAALEKNLAVICNVGDNIWIQGLYVCPDIDTMLYGLANLLDKKRGWGIKNDSFNCLDQLKKTGASLWFGLGDRDLSTHLIRTSMIKSGKSLSQVTDFFRKCYSIPTKLIPATDTEMNTTIATPIMGDMHLQEFWVKHKGRPRVTGVKFANAVNAKANPAAMDAINQSQAIIIAPANPVSSIGPTIALPELRRELVRNRHKVIAISPLVGATAVSGPAVKYMRALGLAKSSVGVATYYRDFVSKFIISKQDHDLALQIEALGMLVYETNTMMKEKKDEIRLCSHILKLVEK